MDKFFLLADDCIFVIIDVQDRLAAVMQARDQVVGNCLHLIELAKLYNIPVIVTEQYPKGLGRTVEPIRNASPSLELIEKLSFSCCSQPDFMRSMHKLARNTIILAGMETHVCVLQTCLDLLKQKYNVHLVSDAVCSRTKDNRETGIGLMHDAGAVVTCTETVLFQILKVAGSEEFKSISKRIK
ncbi:MAG TPA: hydrolase [Dissulfurispiraceae bacterium]|nr:hydrolase [Dissulfurispiraceae bacterium]